MTPHRTRRWILEAALELFVRNGDAARTIQAVADGADVAGATVYAVFGSKRELLRQVIESAIVGDDDSRPSRSDPTARRWRPSPTLASGRSSTRRRAVRSSHA